MSWSEVSLEIRAPAKLLTVNAERRLHWAKRAAIVKDWRHAAQVDARHAKLPAFASARLTVDITQAKGVLADPGGHYPVVKACCDGLVDAGVLPNDDARYVSGIVQNPPTRGKPECVVLTIAGVLLAD